MHGLPEPWPSLLTGFGVLSGAIALGLVPTVVLRRKEPSSTVAWILTLIFLPALGALLFLLFGRDRVRWPARRKRQADEVVRSQVAAARVEGSAPNLALAVAPLSELERQIFHACTALTTTRPSGGNRVALLHGGSETFDALGAAIDAAVHHVHAEYYLIRNDATGAWFRDRLAAAAARGVEVRLLCDGYGCLALNAAWLRPLRRAGGKIGMFLPMRSVLLQPVNLRNHRKIVIVDGALAFSGGVNVGDEYRGTMPSVGAWRDLHYSVEGPAVHGLSGVFLADWYFTTGERLDPTPYFPILTEPKGSASVSIVPSGPDTRTEAIHRLFFAAIGGARERVWITTPYFVPDQAMIVALEVAALRGVEVKLLLPSRSNHRVTFQAGRSFYGELMRAGVEVYEYGPGMIHAKTMVVDGKILFLGSANMDMRSFRLNFEVHALVHDERTATELERRFEEDLALSRRVDPADWHGRSWTTKAAEGTARLLSPLL